MKQSAYMSANSEMQPVPLSYCHPLPPAIESLTAAEVIYKVGNVCNVSDICVVTDVRTVKEKGKFVPHLVPDTRVNEKRRQGARSDTSDGAG